MRGIAEEAPGRAAFFASAGCTARRRQIRWPNSLLNTTISVNCFRKRSRSLSFWHFSFCESTAQEREALRCPIFVVFRAGHRLARLLLEIDIRERSPVAISHDEAGVRFFDGPRRREAARHHEGLHHVIASPPIQLAMDRRNSRPKGITPASM
jgi:hypothetical protein